MRILVELPCSYCHGAGRPGHSLTIACLACREAGSRQMSITVAELRELLQADEAESLRPPAKEPPP